MPDQRLALRAWQTRERLSNIRALGVRVCVRAHRHGFRIENVRRLRPPRSCPSMHEPHVPADRERPWRHGVRLVVGVARAMHLEEGFLHQIVNLVRVARLAAQPPRQLRREQAVQRFKRFDVARLVRHHERPQAVGLLHAGRHVL